MDNTLNGMIFFLLQNTKVFIWIVSYRVPRIIFVEIDSKYIEVTMIIL